MIAGKIRKGPGRITKLIVKKKTPKRNEIRLRLKIPSQIKEKDRHAKIKPRLSLMLSERYLAENAKSAANMTKPDIFPKVLDTERATINADIPANIA
jgi:hypothetical protein